MLVPKFDIRGFAISLKHDSLGAIHEALIRHFVSKALGALYGYYNYPSWLSLFRDLIRRHRYPRPTPMVGFPKHSLCLNSTGLGSFMRVLGLRVMIFGLGVSCLGTGMLR